MYDKKMESRRMMRVMHKRLVALADFSSFEFLVGNKDDASINTFSVFYSLDLCLKIGITETF